MPGTDDPLGGDRHPLAPEEFSVPANTGHGGILPLRSGEWAALAAAFGDGSRTGGRDSAPRGAGTPPRG